MIKVGGAGSIPDGVPNLKEDAASQPLTDFLRVVGGAVFNLNSTVVGLDAVERGWEKPDSLDISWDPQDRTAAARQARKFALEAVLVRCSEAVLQYALAVAKLPAHAARLTWDSNTQSADKVRDVAISAIGKDSYLVPTTMLLTHWRNRVVHTGSRAMLRHQEKQILRKNEEEIRKKYRGLSVDCLLCHFEESRPTLKDISSLIAMAISLAREIDSSIHSELDKDELDAWIQHYDLSDAISRVSLESSPQKRDKSIARTITARAPKLLPSYVLHYGLVLT